MIITTLYQTTPWNSNISINFSIISSSISSNASSNRFIQVKFLSRLKLSLPHLDLMPAPMQDPGQRRRQLRQL